MGSFLFAPLWVILLFYRKELQLKIIQISFFVGILAVIWSPYFWVDYWNPEYIFNISLFGRKLGGIEDFIYGFFTSGIISVIYEELFGKKYARRKDRKHHWFFFTIILFFIGIFIFHFLFYIGLNSLYAAVFSFLFAFLVITFYRADLLNDALISGLFFGTLTFFFYIILLAFFPGIINKWWYLSNISNKLIVGIPIEELVWAFSMGAVAGPIYEFMMGLTFIPYKKTRK